MTLTRKGMNLAQEMNGNYNRKRLVKSVAWTEVYSSVEEMLEELKQIPVIKNMPINPPYKGYEYINSFSVYLNKGWVLSDKQLNICKKLATEIHIAYMIRNEWK